MSKEIFFFKGRLFFVSFLLLFSVIEIYAQPAEKHDADWMRTAKFGIMVHYLTTLQNTLQPHNMGKVTSWDSCVNDFNVNLFAQQIHETGAGYVIFTVYQGTPYLCTPNNAYESVTGYKRGEATSHRDLLTDLYNALHKYNIKLILYVTADGTYRDHRSNVAFNNPMLRWKQNGNKFIATDVWVNNWSKVLHEISMREQNKIDGWWVDGAFTFHGYNDTLLARFYEALKSGNPKSAVAFNASPQKKVIYYSKWDDYTAGEMNDFVDYPPQSGRINGTQWHIVSYLGTDWKSPAVRFKKSYLVKYINKVNSLGGVVTINVALFRNGSIGSAQLGFLKNVCKNIKERK